jgi:hypothetical protein
MTKPAVTLRNTKGSALTYSELDTNFTNLQNATVSLTAGTGGTAVSADLNGNITLVAGTGITLAGNNTAKTVTITGTTSELIDDPTPELGGNLDVKGFNINNTNLSSLPTVIYGGTTSANGAVLTLQQGGSAFATLQTPEGGDINLTTVNGADSVVIKAKVELEATSGVDHVLTTVSPGTGNLIINTLNGTNSGEIKLNSGSNGNIEITPNGNGRVRFASTGGTPSNTSTPASWLQINVAGTLYYLPLYS